MKSEVKPIYAIAVDINQDFIDVGNDKKIINIPARLAEAYHYVKEAQKLQKKYPTRGGIQSE